MRAAQPATASGGSLRALRREQGKTMAKDENKPQQPPTINQNTNLPPGSQPQAPAQTPPPTGVAPEPTPFFEQVKQLENATQQSATASTQKHTFGAWARSKGVKPEQVLQRIKEGHLQAFTGDGPE